MMDNWHNLVPPSVLTNYEVHNFNHSAEILAQAYHDEYMDVMNALDHFSFSVSDLMSGGGNESAIPKKFSALLRPLHWQEMRISGDLHVKLHRRSPSETTEICINDFIDGHNIDYVKNRIALDLEWNSKDQTFDRDLFAFRTFYECGIISCGIIITRSQELNNLFEKLNIKHKYGASTTWMGKLLPHIHARRHGGCPLLIIGITSACITDLGVQ